MRAEEFVNENLHKWFKEKWVRFGPDGKIRGDCARGSDSEGKPKCLPQSKAHALGKKGRATAAARKRREDPNPERRGPAHNVATKESVVETRIIDPKPVDVYYRPVMNSRGRRIVAKNIPVATLDMLLQKLSDKYSVPVNSFEWMPTRTANESQ
jgi:hypothetical protein